MRKADGEFEKNGKHRADALVCKQRCRDDNAVVQLAASGFCLHASTLTAEQASSGGDFAAFCERPVVPHSFLIGERTEIIYAAYFSP